MGEEPGPVAVTDAGPLIHLHEISRLPLLRVFAGLHLAQAVWDEVVTSKRVPEPELATAVFINRYTVIPEDVVRLVAPTTPPLHQGETESLALCRILGVSILLTDDLAARSAAARSGIRPVGSLGVVVRAFHLGRISLSDAHDCLEKLYSVSSLYVTRAVIELAAQQLRTM